MGYAARTKYDEPGRARRYRDRSPERDAEEWRLLERVIRELPGRPRSALDVPCGTGRIAERLIQMGIPTRGADLSAAMRAETMLRLGGRPGFAGAVHLDLEVPTPDPRLRSDLVVCFRLLHHLPDVKTRARVLSTLAELTGSDLLLSFHHPVSAHALKRLAKRVLWGRRSDRHTMTRTRLRREAEAAGLDLVRCRGLGPFRRELWVAWLRPRPPG